MIESNPDVERLIALLSGRGVAAELSDETDWGRIVELAEKQRVAPMLYARLNERGITPSRAAGQQLREIYLASVARNTWLLLEARKVLNALQAADVPVIPLKGACLAETVYGSIAQRPMGDVDLLVKPSDLAEALDVLGKLGYASASPFAIELERQLHKDMPPLSKRGGLTIELHWTIASPRYKIRIEQNDLGQIWSRATPVNIDGVQVLMLAPTDLLLHLCLHASVHHRFNGIGLNNFWDVALVIRRYGDACWEQFAERAHQWGMANGAYLTLQLTGEWTDVIIPPHVMRALMPSRLDDATVEWVRHKIWNGIAPTLQDSDFARLGKERFADRLVALRNSIFQSRISMASMYHAPADSWRIWLYYPVRCKDLWMRYSPAMWQLLRRDNKFATQIRQEEHLRQYLGWS